MELAKDHTNIAANLRNYLNRYSIGAKQIIERFALESEIKKMDEVDILFKLRSKFCFCQLRPNHAGVSKCFEHYDYKSGLTTKYNQIYKDLLSVHKIKLTV